MKNIALMYATGAAMGVDFSMPKVVNKNCLYCGNTHTHRNVYCSRTCLQLHKLWLKYAEARSDFAWWASGSYIHMTGWKHPERKVVIVDWHNHSTFNASDGKKYKAHGHGFPDHSIGIEWIKV